MTKPINIARKRSTDEPLENKGLICLYGKIATYPEFETYQTINETQDFTPENNRYLEVLAAPLMINAILKNDFKSFERLAEIARFYADETDAPDPLGLAILDAVWDLYSHSVEEGEKVTVNRVAKWINDRLSKYKALPNGCEVKTVRDAMIGLGLWPQEKMRAAMRPFFDSGGYR